jgi:GT2 family glycosyltransferase
MAENTDSSTGTEYKTVLRETALELVQTLTEVVNERIRDEEVDRLKREEVFTDILGSKVLDDAFNFKKVLIVVTTPQTEFTYAKTTEYKALEKIVFDNTYTDHKGINSRVELAIVENNTTGLPEVYNRYVTNAYKDYIVCFIHDDLTVYDNHIYEKLTAAHENYGVVGVVGATKINLPFRIDQPTAWHMLSIESSPDGAIRHQSGFVAHEKDGRKWSSMFGAVPQEVKIIDGLLMSFDISECLKNGFTFDEDFQFHHYDLTASLRAREVGMNITTTDIFVSHKGMGEMDESWGRSHRKFVEKYKDFVG